MLHLYTLKHRILKAAAKAERAGFNQTHEALIDLANDLYQSSGGGTIVARPSKRISLKHPGSLDAEAVRKLRGHPN